MTPAQSTPDAPPIQWRDDLGGIATIVELEAYAASLMVVGRPDSLDASDALHSALFDAHRLGLVVPRDASDKERVIGRYIVVGWKPGKAVEQTFEPALPWLRMAQKISVISAPKAGAEPYDSSEWEFFRRLGLGADVIRLEPRQRGVGVRLLTETKRLGGDCLLIGAFPHSPIWEAIRRNVRPPRPFGGPGLYDAVKPSLPIVSGAQTH